MAKILVVDDDWSILEITEDYLTARGYEVCLSKTGSDAMEAFNTFMPDCVVLDVKLPDISGYDICAKMKKLRRVPVIFLSCLVEEGNRISGFIMGGDDYVVKPFSVAELEWRIKARLKDTTVSCGEKITIGNITVDPDTMTICADGEEIELTAKEYEIFLLMARNPGRMFSQEEIFRLIWNLNDNGDVRTVQVHVGNLRGKLARATGTAMIKTVWGKGYMLDRRS